MARLLGLLSRSDKIGEQFLGTRLALGGVDAERPHDRRLVGDVRCRLLSMTA